MFKRIIVCLLMVLVCAGTSSARLVDAASASDGLLKAGEYDGSMVEVGERRTEYVSETLVVCGGGADRISAYDGSYIEVQYTSTPLSNSSGIYDIVLHDDSSLYYLNGVTEEITLYKNSTAILKGGTVDALNIYHGPNDFCYVTIYCQAGYVMDSTGISGLWENGTSFDIDFIDHYPYTTAGYVNIVEVPEPITLVLFGFGSLLIRRKK